ncbi:MAG TPA: AgmX/PglI C-terminal domain-containing protein [Kofleriaceae bacterium]|nr:AgmX/PglI C-terminal domain-containing protein [Kofleriaceae bacterium]
MNKLTLFIAAVSLSALAGACAKQGMTPAVRNEITAKLQSTQTPIQQCYARQLATNRKLAGMVVAQAAIAPDGQFGEVSLRRDEPADPVLRFCVVQEIAKLKLDKPTGERVVLDSIPIKFVWANP